MKEGLNQKIIQAIDEISTKLGKEQIQADFEKMKALLKLKHLLSKGDDELPDFLQQEELFTTDDVAIWEMLLGDEWGLSEEEIEGIMPGVILGVVFERLRLRGKK